MSAPRQCPARSARAGVRQPPLALSRWVKTVRLKQPWVRTELVDEAGNKSDPLLLGDADVEAGESGGVVRAIVRGNIHPEEENRGSRLAAPSDNRAKIGFGVFQRLAAERVVTTQLDDEDLGPGSRHREAGDEGRKR